MILNRKEILADLPQDKANKSTALFNIVDTVLEKLSPQNLIGDFFKKKNLNQYKRIVIFSIGKAAHQMAKATEESLKKFHTRKADLILLADEGHPLPTQKGVLKTKKMIEAGRKLQKNDLAIVLISGGGSAMFIAPLPGISLPDEINLTKQLLKAGAPIQELNTVRKQISSVKGGKFAEILYPATVWGLVISDVIGNDLSSIASGPISEDSSTPADALKILEKYNVKASSKIIKKLEDSKAANKSKKEIGNFKKAEIFKNVKIKIIADHFTALKFAAEKAKKMGFKVTVSKELIQGEAKDVASKWLNEAENNNSNNDNSIFIAAGETTVTCKGSGYGGRNQEFVLSALPHFKKDQIMLSIGTDGIDGICPELIAGVIGTTQNVEIAKKMGLEIPKFLAKNDSYTFFKKTGGLIKTGATGTNLGDLILIMQ